MIVLGSALANNIILNHMVGVDAALASMRQHDVAYGVARIMLVLLPLNTLLAATVTHFVLIPLELRYLQNFVFVLLIIATSHGLKRWADHSRRYHAAVLLPFAIFNTMVLGTLLLNQRYGDHPFAAFTFGLGAALGFALVLFVMAAVNQRMETADVPEAFKGYPIMFLTLGLMGMAFTGFVGLAN